MKITWLRSSSIDKNRKLGAGPVEREAEMGRRPLAIWGQLKVESFTNDRGPPLSAGRLLSHVDRDSEHILLQTPVCLVPYPQGD